MMKKTRDILSFGSCYIDINGFDVPISSNIDLEEELVSENYEMIAGGSAVNSARTFSSLGMNVGFIGKTGKDHQGEILEKLFQKAKVEPILVRSSKVSTNVSVNLSNPDGDTFMVSLGNANQSITPEEIKGILIKNLDTTEYLYLGGIFKLKKIPIDFFLEVVSDAKKKNVKIILDHGRITNTTNERDLEKVKILVESLSEGSWYLPSEDEFLTVWAKGTLKETLKLFANKAVSIAVKRAEKGSMAVAKDGATISIPSFKIKPLNSIGAGDMFNAALISAIGSGKKLKDALRFANAAAAIKISKNILPNFEEVEEFVKDN